MHAWRENNPDYHKLREAKNIQRYYYKPNGYCKICGELIYQEYCGNRRTRKQMHDECVFADCLKAIGEKKALTSIQLQRLAARGYTKEEFVNEFIQTVG